MNSNKMLKGVCAHCGMPIEFPAEAIGTVGKCRFCRNETELHLAPPPEEPTIPRRLIVWIILVLTITALGIAGIFMALKRAEDLSNQRKAAQPAHVAP